MLCSSREGKFDYVGSSHQWWHLIAVVIFVFWHDAGLQLLTYRLSHPCYTWMLTTVLHCTCQPFVTEWHSSGICMVRMPTRLENLEKLWNLKNHRENGRSWAKYVLVCVLHSTNYAVRRYLYLWGGKHATLWGKNAPFYFPNNFVKYCYIEVVIGVHIPK